MIYKQKYDLGEGYILKTGYNTEKNRKFFFIDITKNGENIFYDSELIKDGNNERK